MSIDLNLLTLRELSTLISTAKERQRSLSKRQAPEKVRRQLAVVAKKAGYAIEELFDTGEVAADTTKKARRRKVPKVQPKYRDPESPWNTWTGRGRMPLWLASKIRFGQSPVDYLIPGVAKLTTKNKPLTGKRRLFKQG